MGANAYQAVFRWFNARQAARAALRAVSGGAVAGVYALYIGLLAWLAFTRQPLLLPMAGVPAAVFGLGTLLRRGLAGVCAGRALAVRQRPRQIGRAHV